MKDARGQTIKKGDVVSYATWLHKKPFLQVGVITVEGPWGWITVRNINMKRKRLIKRQPNQVALVEGGAFKGVRAL